MGGKALVKFTSDIGIPEWLSSNYSKEQTGPEITFVRTAKKLHIDLKVSEPHRPEQNQAEGTIRELKKRWFRTMLRKLVPRQLWDFGLVHSAEIMQQCSNTIYGLHGQTPLEEITGEMTNISEYLNFDFYEWCWVKEDASLGPTILCKWLSISHKVGNLMLFWVIKENGEVLSRTLVQQVPDLELVEEDMKAQCDCFITNINRLLDNKNFQVIDKAKDQPRNWNHFTLDNNPDFIVETQRAVPYDKIPEQDEYTADTYNSYLQMELSLSQGADEEPKYSTVTKRLKDKDGRPIRTAHNNPMLDTRLYQVDFANGHSETFAVNVIVENMFAQVDNDGHRQVLLDKIIDHWKDGRVCYQYLGR